MRPVPKVFLAVGSLSVLLAGAACSDRSEPTAPAEAFADGPNLSVVSTSGGKFVTVAVGDTIRVTTRLQPPGKVKWSTSNSSFVRKLGAGTFVAVSPGQAYIVSTGTHRKNLGKKDSTLVAITFAPPTTPAPAPDTTTAPDSTADVAPDSTATPVPDSTVSPAPDTTATPEPEPEPIVVSSVAVTLPSTSLTVGQTTQAAVKVKDAAGRTLGDRSVTWATSNGAVATVSSSGLVKAVAAGTARITATSEGKSGSASVTVTAPSEPTLSGVAISPGQSIQSKVDASPAGTRFVLKAGVHRRQQIVPKDGMVFQGEPGAVLDGENATPYAIGTPSSSSSGVIVRGLVIQNYAPPHNWAGAVGNDGARNWIIENNEIRNNGAAGIRLGPGSRAVGNKIHRNAVMGISAYKAHNAVIENNEVYDNAYTSDVSHASATRAGMKIVGSENVIVRGNTVRDNQSHGIWFDIACRNVIAERNTVVDNGKSGIWVEISYGAKVRYNQVERNGSMSSSWLSGAGIQVSNSPDVEIHGNTVLDNANGITAMQASGYPADAGHGALVVKNLYVHDNIVRMKRGNSGIAQNVGDRSLFTSRNNRFVNNRYTLGTNSGYFAWQDRMGLTVDQWRGYGQDVGGSFTR